MLNIIRAPCGSGKSYFAAHKLPELFPDVAPGDIVFVSPRTSAVGQQAVQYVDAVERTEYQDEALATYYNGGPGEPRDRVQIMTVTKLIWLATHCKTPGRKTLCNVKILVIDEIHAIVTDNFISDIRLVRELIQRMSLNAECIVIGMSATTGILFDKKSIDMCGWDMRMIHDGGAFMYHPKKVRIAKVSELQQVITNYKRHGKVLCMYNNASAIYKLAHEIKDSAVIVSDYGEDAKNNVEMSNLRRYIEEFKTLPDFCDVRLRLDSRDRNGNWKYDEPVTRECNVLFTTSTLREGLEINKESGIKTVIVCSPDDVNVIQTLGRCRFDVDTLIVAHNMQAAQEDAELTYMARQHDEFTNFFYLGDATWLGHFPDMTDDPECGKLVTYGQDAEGFWEVVKQYVGVRVYQQDKRTLADAAKFYGVCRPRAKNRVVWEDVEKILSHEYAVQSGLREGKSDRRRFTLITPKC